MPDSSLLEARLARVEQELAELKSLVQPKSNWIDAITGSFKDDPDFTEIVRLGKELREADRPEQGPT